MPAGHPGAEGMSRIHTILFNDGLLGGTSRIESGGVGDLTSVPRIVACESDPVKLLLKFATNTEEGS
jgi:hypothetical protein